MNTPKTILYHDCAVPGCSRRVPVQMQFCLHCWRKLPYHLRAELKAMHAGHANGTVSAEDVARYVQKAADAILAVSTPAEAKGGDL